MYMLEEGSLPHLVDSALTAFGMPQGPFTMGDLAGLDIGWRIRKGKGLNKSTGGPRYIGWLADSLCEMNRFGQKTGAGWYRYEKGSRKPIPDAKVADMIEKRSRDLGITRRLFDDSEIVERVMFPTINEGFKILEEGIASKPSDIDVVWVYGYGFPRWRGGIMHYADTVGLAKIVARLKHYYAETKREYFQPCKLLENLAAKGASTSEFMKSKL
eukprot:m.107207 g.107207  ORF g.107207 m.107207 type:complete len:214 (+) comp22567_c1_seq6:1677-2318(+)